MSNTWYVKITMPEHPRADSRGQVRRAVLVMEKHLGRFLLPKEEVHHINGIKTDDELENLKLMTHSSHARLHNMNSKVWKKRWPLVEPTFEELITFKRCNKCERILLLRFFWHSRRNGVQSECKECLGERNRICRQTRLLRVAFG